MNSFDWSCPTVVLFGENKISELKAQLINNHAANVLFVYGGGSIKQNGIYDRVITVLKDSNINFVELAGINSNPRIESVNDGKNLCHQHKIDFILAVGGGSVVDCAKAIALASNTEEDFWGVIKNNTESKIENAIPIGVILTLSATGSEMNYYSVISNMQTKEKLSFASPLVIPKFAILDPLYTYSVPRNQISAGVVDAFSHCLEQLFSKEKTALVSDGILIGILWSLVKIGRQAMENPTDYVSHANLMWASTMALNGISGVGKTGDWACHQIEHAVSAYYDITHAVGLAIIFPNWMDYILDESNVDRFYLLGSVFDVEPLGDRIQTAKNVIARLREFFKEMEMPTTLKEIGASESDLDGMVASTLAKNGVESIGSIKPLHAHDIYAILKASM